ncbi:hypothetical protein [Clostridium sp. CF011]|uniref:hypothetical protein n=1 Tax=Clostridium sp. CF011 TaxID=2843318 RepID=UPI00209AB54C|nr:hypothetical protein [Clostridium sp. CF011]WAG69692.1 hypothetical protein LL036_17260 [Clostridium sp. CF011]
MENKIKIKSKFKMVWSLSLVLLILQFLIEHFWGLQLLILGLNANFIRLILSLNLLVSPIYFFNYNKYKLLKKIYGILSVICSIFIIFLYMLIFSTNKYFYFQTPYKNSGKTLVAEETTCLMSGSSNFYEQKYVIFIKPLNESISTDDVVRPFSNDQYKIEWLDENRVQIDYIYNPRGIQKSDIISFN